MRKAIEYLGINTVHFPVENLRALGLSRAEVCRGRAGSADSLEEKCLQEVGFLQQAGMDFGIHLPLLVPPWFQEDYLSAFYLDTDPQRQALSWRLLEYNLERLSGIGAEYGVVHFCGMYDREPWESFDNRLENSLEKLAGLSDRFRLPLRIEYFGSNANWWDYGAWTERISGYPGLGLVTDTGHLHFAAAKHGFDFKEALDALLPVSDSFHLWTVHGPGIYGGSDSYRRFHHIPALKGQHPADGWAFDSEAVVRKLAATGKPVVLEGSPVYGGVEHYVESIRWMVAAFSE